MGYHLHQLSSSMSWRVYCRASQKIAVHLDNIFITGETDEEHLQILDEVLEQLETARLRNMQLSRPQK